MQGWTLAVALLLAGTLGASGCFGAGCDASNTTSGQAAVCNNKNDFSYAMNAGATSSTETYAWENSQSKASVNWASNLGLGSVTIVIKDEGGKQVYSKTYSGTGQGATTQSTDEGQPGSWTIEVRLSNVSGQVSFHVRAA